MVSLVAAPSGPRIHSAPGETVLVTLRRAGVGIESPCGGEGICGKCRVRVEDPAGVAETPHHCLSPEEVREGWRLACLLVPERDLTVHLPYEPQDACILEGERFSADRVDSAARVVWRDRAAWLEYPDEAAAELPGWQPETSPKGLAIDLGTTTLVVTLLDLASGHELATASALNPQSQFGHDVLSRIQEGSTAMGLAQLTSVVRKALNGLIDKVCSEAGAAQEEVLDAVVGANTTMLQLAAEIDPARLGRVPFRVGIEGGKSYPAAFFGLELHPSARVYVPPVLQAFVGSDISAGLMACRFFERKGPILFVDIGTNGELALGVDGCWFITSAAAGPAFEGVGISQGMRAAPGAVEAVRAEEDGLHVQVIGGGPARGVCGSGLIDAMACLRRVGVLDASGRMLRPAETGSAAPWVTGCLVERDGKPVFALVDGVQITQNDVRQFQLAKGALRTAIDLLLAEARVDHQQLREVVMAGAFGYHLWPQSLEAIGLLPPGLAERVTFAGNTSRLGSARLLLDRNARMSLDAWVARSTHLSLPESTMFQDAFVNNLSFPG